MSTNSGSWLFPFETDYQENSLRRTTTVIEMLKSAMKAFLLTSPGERRGNNIGSSLPSYKHKLMSEGELKTISSVVKQELVDQFPGVAFYEVGVLKGIDHKSYTLKVEINYSTPYSDIQQLEVFI